MVFNVKNGLLHSQDNTYNINFLKQNFPQLSAEEQSHLKDYLKSLVSLQNIITGTDSADSVHILIKGNRDGK